MLYPKKDPTLAGRDFSLPKTRVAYWDPDTFIHTFHFLHFCNSEYSPPTPSHHSHHELSAGPLLWPRRLAVRTRPFQGRDRSSILRGVICCEKAEGWDSWDEAVEPDLITGRYNRLVARAEHSFTNGRFNRKRWCL